MIAARHCVTSDDNPGSLRLEEYAVAIAYILQRNGIPSGSATLPSQRANLNQIIIDWKR